MTNLRVSQAPLEVLYSSDSSIRVTQSVLQVLYKTELNVFAPTGDISVGNWTPTPIFQQIDADDANSVVTETTPSFAGEFPAHGSTFAYIVRNLKIVTGKHLLSMIFKVMSRLMCWRSQPLVRRPYKILQI